jgi:hypothetical protein
LTGFGTATVPVALAVGATFSGELAMQPIRASLHTGTRAGHTGLSAERLAIESPTSSELPCERAARFRDTFSLVFFLIPRAHTLVWSHIGSRLFCARRAVPLTKVYSAKANVPTRHVAYSAKANVPTRDGRVP